MPKIIVAFDTDTTGLISPSANDVKDQPYITEIYLSKHTEDGKLISEFETFLKVPVPITSEITKIIGITDETLREAPSFVEAYKHIAKFLTGVNILTAHNLAFDRNMLANECLRIDRVLQMPWPMTHICTVRSSKHYEGYRLSLTKLHEYLFGEPFEGAHRAKIDVQAQTRCFFEMVKRGDIVL